MIIIGRGGSKLSAALQCLSCLFYFIPRFPKVLCQSGSLSVPRHTPALDNKPHLPPSLCSTSRHCPVPLAAPAQPTLASHYNLYPPRATSTPWSPADNTSLPTHSCYHGVVTSRTNTFSMPGSLIHARSYPKHSATSNFIISYVFIETEVAWTSEILSR